MNLTEASSRMSLEAQEDFLCLNVNGLFRCYSFEYAHGNSEGVLRLKRVYALDLERVRRFAERLDEIRGNGACEAARARAVIESASPCSLPYSDPDLFDIRKGEWMRLPKDSRSVNILVTMNKSSVLIYLNEDYSGDDYAKDFLDTLVRVEQRDLGGLIESVNEFLG